MKKVSKKTLGIIIVVLLIALAGAWFFLKDDALYDDPQVIAETTLTELATADNFRYSLTARVQIGEDALDYGQMTGEKNASACHISGKLLGSEVEVYQIGEDFYQKDILTGNWHKYTGQLLAESRKLLADLDPQMNFQFQDMGLIEYLGEEKLEGEKYLKIAVNPNLADQWINENFHDITYTLWISPKEKKISFVNIVAQTDEGQTSAQLQMQLAFWDYGKVEEIKAPMSE